MPQKDSDNTFLKDGMNFVVRNSAPETIKFTLLSNGQDGATARFATGVTELEGKAIRGLSEEFDPAGEELLGTMDGGNKDVRTSAAFGQACQALAQKLRTQGYDVETENTTDFSQNNNTTYVLTRKNTPAVK